MMMSEMCEQKFPGRIYIWQLKRKELIEKGSAMYRRRGETRASKMDSTKWMKYL
jgi:hypothetical protein